MKETQNQIYSIAYCSRNCVHGHPEQVKQELREILAASRRNNAKLQVTGALLYNAGSFAQVLEGPVSGVERIFENIQRDARHSEVTVIESGFMPARRFPEWAMAFAGGSSIEGSPVASAALEAVYAGAASAAEELLKLLENVVVEEADWILLDTSAMPR